MFQSEVTFQSSPGLERPANRSGADIEPEISLAEVSLPKLKTESYHRSLGDELREANGAVLSLKEMLSVNTVADLTALYKGRGFEVKSERDFLRIVEHDWRIHQEEYLSNAASKPWPDTLPAIEVKEGGLTHHIYGVCHTTMLGQDYLDMVNGTIKSAPGIWLTEQNLGSVFRAAASSRVIEVMDHEAAGRMSMFGIYFGNALKQTFGLPLALLGGLIAIASPETINRMQEKAKEKLFSWAKSPSEILARKLPAYVSLELKEKAGEGYNWVELRSAYQAEFMKAVGKFTGEDCRILVGALHAPEIKYFLEHGCKNSEVVKLAQSHARMLLEGVGDYHSFQAVSRLSTFFTISLPAQIASWVLFYEAIKAVGQWLF